MMEIDPNLEHAIQTRQKFEFYLVALVFAILGLSVQTAQFYGRIQCYLEVTAWICLLISGIVGLSRLEWVPVLHEFYAGLTEEKSLAKELKKGRGIIKSSGEPYSEAELSDYIQNLDERINKRKTLVNKMESTAIVKYNIHKWLFVVAILLLTSSRVVHFGSVKNKQIVSPDPNMLLETSR